MLMQNFGVTIKEHYGMLWYFLEWSIAYGLEHDGLTFWWGCTEFAGTIQLTSGKCSFALLLVRFYEGVVDLCLQAAVKCDPQGLALHFYRNGEPHGDVQGEEAFLAR